MVKRRTEKPRRVTDAGSSPGAANDIAPRDCFQWRLSCSVRNIPPVCNIMRQHICVHVEKRKQYKLENSAHTGLNGLYAAVAAAVALLC